MSSRLPQPKARYSPSKPSTPALRSRTPVSSSPTKPPRSPNKPIPKPIHDDLLDEPEKPKLSTRELIALKRAEAKKAQASRGASGIDSFTSIEDALPSTSPHKREFAEEDILGRLSIRETIERARSTGSVNLSTRSLPCLPSALFEIHLGITPDKLKSVPDEPRLPPASPEDVQGPGSRRHRGGHDAPAWFEAQDLQVIKAGINEILEIQHEISLFGSLKTVDLHGNKLTSLPESFADLTALSTLDLSQNALTSLPVNIFALPELVNLNLAHNSLSSLPFNAPFANKSTRGNQPSSTSFFMPTVTRATSTLPKLLNLDISHNKISAPDIDRTIPPCLTKFSASGNPLVASTSQNASMQELLRALASLCRLKEARFDGAAIGDDSVPSALLSPIPNSFPSLRVLDFGETKVTVAAAEAAFTGPLAGRQISFEYTNNEPPDGVVQILVGKKVVREAWEIEADRRTQVRKQAAQLGEADQGDSRKVYGSAKAQQKTLKESWEIEAEQGLLTEGGRRRARAAAAAAAAESANQAATPSSSSAAPEQAIDATLTDPTDASASGGSDRGTVIASPSYYTATTQTLVLPPSVPAAAKSKALGHSRAFSAAPSWSSASKSAAISDIALPTPTLPLALISQQSFAQTLRILTLNKRRLDRVFDLPTSDEPSTSLLPKLEELSLAGCDLGDTVSVSRSGASTPSERSNEPLLPLILRLFPSLRILDLSYNALTSAALSSDVVKTLVLADADGVRRGLTHLRLQGNRLVELDGLADVARGIFAGGHEEGKARSKLEELDIRDNAVEKLPPELGLLPLDVLLVDGNLFRIPQRRVWEREGSKGLLTWLRGRLE
ncbi:hypothetical protein HGRIS_004437 [Hohenbuehelia grisea]|uniref:Leucine-rich repeat-containing protein 40 n=1 Tax=Hohenbuehelia grisea TaxID=104357 RepID=A0ABR3JC99_9AGAR